MGAGEGQTAVAKPSNHVQDKDAPFWINDSTIMGRNAVVACLRAGQPMLDQRLAAVARRLLRPPARSYVFS
jgi:hypothetical protein